MKFNKYVLVCLVAVLSVLFQPVVSQISVPQATTAPSPSRAIQRQRSRILTPVGLPSFADLTESSAAIGGCR